MAEAVKARSGGSDDSKIVSFMIEYMRKKIENLDTKINEEINVRVGVEANVAKLNDYIEQMQYKIKEAEDNLAWEFPSVSLFPSSDIRYRRENMIIKDATHNESIDSEMSIERENPEHYIEQKNIKNSIYFPMILKVPLDWALVTPQYTFYLSDLLGFKIFQRVLGS